MRENKGIALIVLLIILVAVGIVLFSGIQYTKEYFNKQKEEDIKATMFSIQRVITNIKNKHTVDEENNLLVGTKIDLDNNETEYIISDELKQNLQTLEAPDLYILNQEDLNNNGVKDVNVNNEEFYIIDYNSTEVFYSLGIEGKYKLSEM